MMPASAPSQATTQAPEEGRLPKWTTPRWEQLQMAPCHGQAITFVTDLDLVGKRMM